MYVMIYSILALAVQSKIKFSNKSSKDYLPSRNYDSFSVTPTTTDEIDVIIFSLKCNKSTGSNNIHFKILKLIENHLSQHLVDILNLSFKTGIFLDSLKIAKKVIPIHKNDSKLVDSYY